MTDQNDADAPTGKAPPGAIAAAATRALPKRFYKGVEVAGPTDGGYRLLLDGRTLRTPRRQLLEVPSLALAQAIAAEWDAQETVVDPASMPLARFANSALDMVTERMDDVRADIVRFAGSDLVLYRAADPVALVERQQQHWDPVIEWCAGLLGSPFETSTGIIHKAQSPATLERIASRIANIDRYRLAALHVITSLTGSALLALAVHENHLTPSAAWAAAHVDEDWQISRWGEDEAASARRAATERDMMAACRLLQLCAGN